MLNPPYDKAPWPKGDSIQVPVMSPPNADYVSGKVDVLMLVSDSGIVKKWVIAAKPASLGYEESVKTALRNWNFNPAQQGGENVPAWINICFRFEVNCDMEECSHGHLFVKIPKQMSNLSVFHPPTIAPH